MAMPPIPPPRDEVPTHFTPMISANFGICSSKYLGETGSLSLRYVPGLIRKLQLQLDWIIPLQFRDQSWQADIWPPHVLGLSLILLGPCLLHILRQCADHALHLNPRTFIGVSRDGGAHLFQRAVLGLDQALLLRVQLSQGTVGHVPGTAPDQGGSNNGNPELVFCRLHENFLICSILFTLQEF
jgi:hypothetical protein